MKLITFFLSAATFFCNMPTKTSDTITTKPQDPLSKDGLTKQREYHIGPLDLLDIKVLYSDEVSRQVRVDSRGHISLPLLGVVKAAGLTPFELEQSITNKLSVDLIQNPQVTVFIKEFTSQRMTVQGVVTRAGVYDFQGQATLLQAISMAGGLSDKGDETSVKVIRKLPGKNEETLTYDINVIRENKMDDPVLENGDVVMVEEKKPISVQGSVRLSGIYYLRGSASLMQVLAQAGGTSDAADTSDVSIASKLPDGKTWTQTNITNDNIKSVFMGVNGNSIVVGNNIVAYNNGICFIGKTNIMMGDMTLKKIKSRIRQWSQGTLLSWARLSSKVLSLDFLQRREALSPPSDAKYNFHVLKLKSYGPKKYPTPGNTRRASFNHAKTRSPPRLFCPAPERRCRRWRHGGFTRVLVHHPQKTLGRHDILRHCVRLCADVYFNSNTYLPKCCARSN